MKYIYLLLWFSFKNTTKSDGKKYKGYRRGNGQFSGHVVGGVEVPITMYPHVATIIIGGHHLCGGSIVSDRVVLTAGHCVIDVPNLKIYEPDVFEVFFGSKYRSRGTRYEVCKVVLHESHALYDSGHTTPRYFYDIALLMLNRQIKFGSTIKKVQIAPNESWRKEKYSFTVAGFGETETGGKLPQKLLATRMHYVDSTTCNQSQSNVPMIVPDHMFCMIGQRWTSDCFGDSGSGVIWRGYIVGVVSTGRDKFCGSDMMPSMYTDVTYFRNWINLNIKEASSFKDEDCQSRTKQRISLWTPKSRAELSMAEFTLFRSKQFSCIVYLF